MLFNVKTHTSCYSVKSIAMLLLKRENTKNTTFYNIYYAF